MDDFKEAKETIRGIKQAEKFAERKRNRECDWTDEADVLYYKRERHRDVRLEDIKRIHPRMVCPQCNSLTLNSGKWVLSDDRSQAVCRSCYWKDLAVKPSKGGTVSFLAPVMRLEIDPERLTHARKATGLSIRAFAKIVGWAHSYQFKLESGEVRTINYDAARDLQEAFRRRGIVMMLPEGE